MTAGPANVVIIAASAAFLVGACIGSFLNVVIYRLQRGESIISPRSRCPGCGHAIRAWENIPIVSFVALRGKCAGCGGRISWRYPVVELLTASGFAAIFLLDGPGIPLLRDLLFFSLLLPIAFIDIDHRIIPDELSLGGLAAGIFLSFLPGGDWKGSVGGALLGGGILYATAFLYEKIRGAEGMGGGDIKLLAMIGAFVGVARDACDDLLRCAPRCNRGDAGDAKGRGGAEDGDPVRPLPVRRRPRGPVSWGRVLGVDPHLNTELSAWTGTARPL